MLNNSSFWKNKSVLVTGAKGFVGSNLIKRLLRENAVITTFTKHPIASPSILLSEKLLPHIHAQEVGNIEDTLYLERIIKKNNIDIIYHLAAQSLVEVGKETPISTFDVNIKGTWSILESARQTHVSKIIIASTAHVYGDNRHLPYKEEYYPQPSRPYETSKACADLLAQCYADTYNLPVEIPRFVNIYGPGDFSEGRIIPKLITQILAHKNPHVWDEGIIRDFLYIDDAINAYLLLAEKNLSNTKRIRVMNIGTGKPVNITTVAEKIMMLANDKNLELVREPTPKDREKEVKKQYVSIEKAKKVLDWDPSVSLDEGLEKTVAWYKENYSSFSS